MIYYVLSRWDSNNDTLKEALEEKGYEWLNSCEYKDLVKMVCDYILTPMNDGSYELDSEHITEIDNGYYQGTLLYLIPFNTYQPNESEYLMTYVGYGSCSGCDTLQGIQAGMYLGGDLYINDFMTLCKDICSNMIRPYNTGWREDTIFNTVTEVK